MWPHARISAQHSPTFKELTTRCGGCWQQGYLMWLVLSLSLKAMGTQRRGNFMHGGWGSEVFYEAVTFELGHKECLGEEGWRVPRQKEEAWAMAWLTWSGRKAWQVAQCGEVSCVCVGWKMDGDAETSKNSFQVLFKVMKKLRYSHEVILLKERHHPHFHRFTAVPFQTWNSFLFLSTWWICIHSFNKYFIYLLIY